MKSLDILICLGGVSLTNAINSLRPRGSCAFTYAVTWGSASTNFCCDVRADMCQLESDGTTYTCVPNPNVTTLSCLPNQTNCINAICCDATTETCQLDTLGYPSCVPSTTTTTTCPDNQFGCATNLCCQSGTEQCVPNSSAALGWECQAIDIGRDSCPNGQTRVEGYDLCCPSADHYVENGTPHCGRRPDDNTPTTPNTGGGSPAPGGNNQVTPSRSASASATRAASNEALRGSGLNKVGEITMLGLLAMLLVV